MNDNLLEKEKSNKSNQQNDYDNLLNKLKEIKEDIIELENKFSKI
tara:strand:- start:143 stop:277 length:135 start_codon:yes stop_codon:yes gene_type:complete